MSETRFYDCPDCGAGGVVPTRDGECTNCGHVLVGPATKQISTSNELGSDAMEEFGYKGGYKFHGAWQCGYPLIGLGGIAAFLPLVRDGYAEFITWVPLLVIGLIGWLIYEIVKASSRFKFLLRISDKAIEVGDGPKVEWENVERAEFHGFGFGKTPIITLVTQAGKT